jgi:hypothetical protein
VIATRRKRLLRRLVSEGGGDVMSLEVMRERRGNGECRSRTRCAPKNTRKKALWSRMGPCTPPRCHHASHVTCASLKDLQVPGAQGRGRSLPPASPGALRLRAVGQERNEEQARSECAQGVRKARRQGRRWPLVMCVVRVVFNKSAAKP